MTEPAPGTVFVVDDDESLAKCREERRRVMQKMQAASLAHLLSMAGQAGVRPG